MVNVYIKCIEANSNQVNGEIFNAGYDNYSVTQIANVVKDVIGDDIEIENKPTNDNRSYHISSEKIYDKLKFRPNFTIKNAVQDLKKAFEENKLPDSLKDTKYFNIKKMQEINLN